MTFVRDPIERLFSVYRFERGSVRDHSHFSSLARQTNFSTFINVIIKTGHINQISNIQAKFILDGAEYSNFAMNLHRESGVIFSVTEKYEKACSVIEHQLKEFFPDFKLNRTYAKAIVGAFSSLLNKLLRGADFI